MNLHILNNLFTEKKKTNKASNISNVSIAMQYEINNDSINR